MADIELVIKIPKKVYKSICNMENPICRTTLMVSIANGTPLEEYCNSCESGNPCLYCKHKFEEVAESEDE